MANQIVWVDISVADLDRAIKFYSEVLGKKVTKQESPGGIIGLLPHDQDGVTGCLVVDEDSVPSKTGALIYLSVDGYLDIALSYVVPFGGKIIKGAHPIGPYGYRAIILDSEGNRVALHSRKT